MVDTIKSSNSVKVKTDEQQMNTTNAELQEELNLKKTQLKDCEARLNGGFCPSMQKDLRSVDDELEEAETVVEMQEIQISKDAPLTPKYTYEQDDRWRELQKKGVLKIIEGNKKHIKTLKEQKETITKDLPILKARIAELEKKLNIKPKGAKK